MFAVLLVLSVSVCPAVAAEVTQNQVDAYRADTLDDLIKEAQIRAVTLTESTAGASPDQLSASSVDADPLNFEQGIFSIHINDPLTPDASTSGFSASSIPADDTELVEVFDSLNQEGYTLTGQTEHQYHATVTSEKFQHLDPMQGAALASRGFALSVTDTDTVATTEHVNYYIFTNSTTNATRVVTTVQLVGTDGTPVGDRKFTVSPNLPENNGAPTGDGEFTASVAGEILGVFVAVCVVPGPLCWATLTLVAAVIIVTVVITAVLVLGYPCYRCSGGS
jgi:hypothetical protein